MLLPKGKHQKEHPSSHPKMGSLAFPFFEDETSIYAAETETVTHHSIQFCVTFFKHDIKWFCAFIQLGHVDVWSNKVILHHQDRVHSFLNTSSAKAVTSHRLGRAQCRHFAFTKRTFHGFQLGHVTSRCRCTVSIH